jgi:hypothetical protein
VASTQPTASDFFISYTKANRGWAEWIAWQVEAAGFTTVMQAWDFRPGRDWTHAMHDAMANSRRTVAVLSPDYLASVHGEAEWRAAYASDPTGEGGVLLPVRVAECEPPGLLKTRVFVDLVGLDERAAQAALLAGVHDRRAKPTSEPAFPGRERPHFPRDDAITPAPGASGDAPQRAAPVPALKPPKSIRASEQFSLKHGASPVAAVAFTPDGTRLLTGGGDRIARIWALDDGIELARLEHGKGVSSIAVSPDSVRVATAATDDRTIRIWAVDGGRELVRFKHGSALTGGWVAARSAVAFSPDGDRVATAASDNTARVWTLDGHQVLSVKHRFVGALAFGDGARLATGGGDMVRVWAIDDGRELSRVGDGGFFGSVHAVAFGPEGSSVATVGGKLTTRVRIYELHDGREMFSAEIGGFDVSADLALSADGGLVAAVCGARLRVWRVDGGREVLAMDFAGAGLRAVAFSPDGALLAIAGGEISGGDNVRVLRLHNEDSSTAGAAR